MLKNTLIFAIAALTIAFAAPSLLVGLGGRAAPGAPCRRRRPGASRPRHRRRRRARPDLSRDLDRRRRRRPIPRPGADRGSGGRRDDRHRRDRRRADVGDRGAPRRRARSLAAALEDEHRQRRRVRQSGHARSISLGAIYMNDVQAVVMPPGASSVNLLGASLSSGSSASSSATARWCCASRRRDPFARRGDRLGMGDADPSRAAFVPQAAAQARAQHLRLRSAADGQADRLPRIRRALALRARDQPDGRAGARPRPRYAARRSRRRQGDRRRPRLPLLFRRDQERADRRTDGGRRQGARHRPRDHADGLFRPVRARRSRRRDGHRLAQRQRLDRRQDGGRAAGDVRTGRDGTAARHRARRRVPPERRRRL